jgi:UDP-N-acetylglucosamine 2-epimerase (non-hydrolysing)
MKKILSVFGTRPEAIKMAPLLKALEKEDSFNSQICVTAQHREMLDQVLHDFKLIPDFDLDLMKKKQTLSELTASIISQLPNVFKSFRPDIVLVHGDTATTFATSIAAYFEKIPVAHIEAGLRSGNNYSPWPEEVNRRLTGVIADIHFAPTKIAKANLLNENVNEKSIHVTGNTVIDALMLAKSYIESDQELINRFNNEFHYIDKSKKLILVTGHRRESFGKGFEKICEAIKEVATKNKELQIIYPVHLNPNVSEPVNRILSGIDNVFLIEPLEYLPFIHMMSMSYLILTDSGGIQEEAPSLGKPVLVMRETTERPEAVTAGTVKLVGTNVDLIVSSINELVDDNSSLYKKMSYAHNPYGDGTSCSKIISILNKYV